ncbi:MAG: hypothetical protein MJY67_05970 [Bacteroidales bacterium]|nr:hypothetical protein [Bacteroidales bacterium]
MMKRLLVKHIYMLFPLFFACQISHAQSVSGILAKADSLRVEYCFEESLALYDKALAAEPDSLRKMEILSSRALVENGAKMMDYVSEPVVVARQKFSLEDFFLYYPLDDKLWCAKPNQLDSVAHPLVKATCVPSDASTLYFSAADASGCRNIYRTDMGDESWTYPVLLNESMTSASDEIYPMLSTDEKDLYFASNGLYGVGGYDLYVAHWNERTKDWDAPVNMGFPYSSPYDDFLYVNSPDGKYTVFASNRECGKDSVYVYVLEYESTPIRKSVGNPSLMKDIASLIPEDDQTRLEKGGSITDEISENVETLRYMDKMEEVTSLRDSISVLTKELSLLRKDYELSDDEDQRERIAKVIIEGEGRLPGLGAALDEASAQLRKIEMDFLYKGVVIDPDKLMERADREVAGATAAYTFLKMDMAPWQEMAIDDPIVVFDYGFNILEEGQFAQDQRLPDGAVFQIWFLTSSTKAKISQLKGLTPVYEKKKDGKYFYKVGLFASYAEALGNLNKVKKLGFREVKIVAYIDGEPVNVDKAREWIAAGE